MEAADVKRAANVAWGTVRSVRQALRRSPALALITAVTAGFVAGLVLRCLEKPKREGAEERER
jgi:hypothetical protein